MPIQLEWLRAINLWDLLALAIAGGGVVAGLRWLRPGFLRLLALIERVHGVLDDWHGKPEQRDASGALVKAAEPGVVARLKAVEYHVKPNGGESAHDGLVKRLDRNTASLESTARSVAELRALVVDLMESHAALTIDYHRALPHNHPDYTPDQ